MSYKITEAARKHIAAIEDLVFELRAEKVADGQTKNVSLFISDGDKLEKTIELPTYSIVKNDVNGIRLVNNGDPDDFVECQDIGNDFTIFFGMEKESGSATKYIKSIILKNTKTGATSVLNFSAFSDLDIKNINVDNNINVDGKATFNDGTTIDENGIVSPKVVNLNGTGELRGVKLGKIWNALFWKNVKFVSHRTPSEGFTTPTVVFGGLSDGDADLEENEKLPKAIVNFVNAEVTADENTEFNIANLIVNEAAITALAADNAEIKSLLTSKNIRADNINTDGFSANTSNLGHADVRNLSVSEQFETSPNSVTHLQNTTTIDNAKISKEAVTTSSIADAEITNASITNANVISLNAQNATAKNATVKDSLTVEKNVNAATVTLTGSTTDEDGETVPVAGKIINGLNSNTMLSADDTTVFIGNDEDKTVIISAGNGSEDNENYHRIKAIVGGKETYLMTLQDAKDMGVDNVVDKTSNQSIKGIKQFENSVFANDAIKAKHRQFDSNGDKLSEEDRLLIYRGPSLEDSKSYWIDNPEFKEAQEKAKAFDKASAKRSAVVISANAMNRAFNNIDKKRQEAANYVVENKLAKEITKKLLSNEEFTGTYKGDSSGISEFINEQNTFVKKAGALKTAIEETVRAEYSKIIDDLKSNVDSYNEPWAGNSEKQIHFNYEGEDVEYNGFVVGKAAVSENFETIYNTYDASMNENETAKSYINDVKKIFSYENLKKVAYTGGSENDEHVFNTLISANSLDDFFEAYKNSISELPNTLKRVLDIYTSEVCSNPSFTDIPSLTDNLTNEGIYENGDKYEIWTFIGEDLYKTAYIYKNDYVSADETTVIKYYNNATLPITKLYNSSESPDKNGLVNSYFEAKDKERDSNVYIENVKKSIELLNDKNRLDAMIGHSLAESYQISAIEADGYTNEAYDSLDANEKEVLNDGDVASATNAALDAVVPFIRNLSTNAGAIDTYINECAQQFQGIAIPDTYNSNFASLYNAYDGQKEAYVKAKAQLAKDLKNYVDFVNDPDNGVTFDDSYQMPDDIGSFNEKTLDGCTSLATINFAGTQEQWNAIEKGEGWNEDCPSGMSINYGN